MANRRKERAWYTWGWHTSSGVYLKLLELCRAYHPHVPKGPCHPPLLRPLSNTDFFHVFLASSAALSLSLQFHHPLIGIVVFSSLSLLSFSRFLPLPYPSSPQLSTIITFLLDPARKYDESDELKNSSLALFLRQNCRCRYLLEKISQTRNSSSQRPLITSFSSSFSCWLYIARLSIYIYLGV